MIFVCVRIRSSARKPDDRNGSNDIDNTHTEQPMQSALVVSHGGRILLANERKNDCARHCLGYQRQVKRVVGRYNLWVSAGQ